MGEDPGPRAPDEPNALLDPPLELDEWAAGVEDVAEPAGGGEPDVTEPLELAVPALVAGGV